MGLGLVAAHVAAVEVRVPLANGREPQSKRVLGGGIHGNQLTGSLEPLQQCTELTGFDVRGNQLTGGI